MVAAKAKKNKFTRDSDGLLDGTDYVFNEDGTINWRGMIKPNFLVANRQKTKRHVLAPLLSSSSLIHSSLCFLGPKHIWSLAHKFRVCGCCLEFPRNMIRERRGDC